MTLVPKKSVSHPASNPLPEFTGEYRTVCMDIPDTPEHLAQLHKWLWPLSLWTNYIRTGDNSGSIAAQQWRRAILSLRWCDVPNTLIREIGSCGFEVSYDGGETWETINFNCGGGGRSVEIELAVNQQHYEYILNLVTVNANNIYTTVYPLNVDTGTANKDKALCYAAHYFIGSWCYWKANELAFAFFGLTVFLAAFAVITGGLGLLVGMATGGAGLTAGWAIVTAYEAVTNETAIKQVACDFAAEMNSRLITFTNWRTAWQALSYAPGSHEQIIVDMMSEIYDNSTMTSRTGLNRLLDAATRAWYAEWFYCPCPPCAEVIDLETTPATWQLTTGTRVDTIAHAGSWSAEGALDNHPVSGVEGRLIELDVDLGGCVATRLSFSGRVELGNPNGALFCGVYEIPSLGGADGELIGYNPSYGQRGVWRDISFELDRPTQSQYVRIKAYFHTGYSGERRINIDDVLLS